MKRFRTLLLAASLGLLSACGGGGTGMSASEYLTENVAFWNGAASTVQEWTVGNKSEPLQKALATGEGLDTLKPGLQRARTEMQQYLTRIDQMPPDEEAKDVHQKLRAYVQSAEEMFGILLEMASLPADKTQAQVQPLAEKLQTVGDRIDVEMQALDAAQDAYAKKHGIQLQRH